MANASEIQNRINSIQDTMKITKAMYMISSNKLMKAKQNQLATEPYFYGIQRQITRLLRHMPDIEHIYFDNREEDKLEKVKRQGFVIVTADKGMAGAYNHNVLKKAKELYDHSENPHMYVIGELGYQFFRSHGMPMEEEFHYIAQNPTMNRARMIANKLIYAYDREQLDQIYMVYTSMGKGGSEDVVVEQLLPLVREDFSGKIPGQVIMETYQEEFKLLPSAKAVIDNMVPNYLTGYVYGALIEAFCSEQNARMQAMQSATDNAEAMLHELSIEFNRVRQAAITQEITEVIGGAKALKRKKAKKEQERKRIKNQRESVNCSGGVV